jgi:hypothetical protein
MIPFEASKAWRPNYGVHTWVMPTGDDLYKED